MSGALIQGISEGSGSQCLIFIGGLSLKKKKKKKSCSFVTNSIATTYL